METLDIDDERTHSIKLPSAVEVFANLKNAQKFAIDIGMFCPTIIVLPFLCTNLIKIRIYFKCYSKIVYIYCK